MDTELTRLSRIRSLAEQGLAKSIRVNAGLSLLEMANAIGVAPSTVWRWEEGHRTPKGDAALRYEHAISDLIGAKR